MTAGEAGRVALLGVVAAAGVLLLSDLAGELRAAGGLGSSRWALAAQAGAGAVGGAGALAGRRSAAIPAIAGLLLLWPVLAGVALVGAPPAFLPLVSAAGLDGASLSVATGVLAAGAVDALRR